MFSRSYTGHVLQVILRRVQRSRPEERGRVDGFAPPPIGVVQLRGRSGVREAGGDGGWPDAGRGLLAAHEACPRHVEAERRVGERQLVGRDGSQELPGVPLLRSL